MIRIRGLNKRYGDFDALTGIDLDVAPGEFLVVLGPSGAGKSTLLRCINRLAEPTSGEIHIDGQLAQSGGASLRGLRRQVAMIFQHYNVVPRLSVQKNVLTGRMGAVPAVLSWLQIFPRKDVAIALECLRRVELQDKAGLRTDTLSGGQKQRVGIARALAQQPKVILADEPVASLDPKTSRTVLNYLKQASRELGITVVCNLHQIDYAREFGERIVGVSGGRIVYDGGPEGLTDEVLKRIYPGLDENDARSRSAPAVAAAAAPALRQLKLEEAST
ncbi:phosphonate ABC transporter ATP-binding protein [Acidovorax sp. sif1233]|uniref:phosphonate ABC transporter ATP-binding protein n=1 Tax=Acidovorax sp. sif1233 TaxID=2854792 RepID=UPI001C44D3FA|nr:phosphonate ABC transporter ATP-binding protein [Acidovorax sp. sif1233]MBV7454174.1 phosphonate ABC transporter ATP-binding protein [Acidovorax sp. sif1233]